MKKVRGKPRPGSEHKQTELYLRESEDAMKSLLNATSDVACLIDTEGTLIAANGVLARRLGRGIDDLIGQNIFDFFPQEKARARRSLTRKAIESGKPVRFEDTSVDNGHFDTCIYPLLNAEGKVVSLAVYAKDTTEARQAGLALAESEVTFKQFFDSMNDGISVRDARTFELLDANRRFCEMYGYTLEELKALPLGSLAANESADERRRRLGAHYAQVTGEVSRLFQAQGKRKDGNSFWVEVNVRRITMGGRECLLAVARDITERRETEEALRESEARFKQLFDNVNDGVVVRDARTFELLNANRRFCDMWGYTFEELKALPLGSLGALEPVEQRRKRLMAYYAQAPKGIPSLFQWPARKKDGSVFWVELNATKITIGTREFLLVAVRDITKRKEAEDALRESEARFKQLFDSVNDGIAVRDAITFEILDANRKYCEISGYTLEELKGLPLGSFGTGESLDERQKRLTDYYRQVTIDTPSLLELEGKRKDGSIFWAELNATKITIGTRDCLLSVARDITERKRAEEKIKASLREKEVLLKEVHHRVKNNLQIISSLLYLQAKRTEHPGAVSALTESRARIKSMALIHERLYASPDLASIDMGKYTRNLLSDLSHSHMTEDDLVRLTLNIEDISLGITEAIPCGLIINELVSNALKHAFLKGQTGEITIELQRAGANQVTLTVSDNGVGFPEQIDFRKSPSLGLTLINSLVEQLGGTIELDRRGGTTFTITFP
jgi:PAS domain S-box-containing protein